MFSTLLELAGLAAIVAATYLLGGLVPSLYTTGGLLLLVGYATEDKAAAVVLSRVLSPLRRRWVAVRAGRELRRRRREQLAAKAG